jgi:chromosome segregation ATPase
MSARLKLVTWANKALEQKNKDLKQQITTTNATIEGLQKGRNEQKTRISQLLAKVASLEIDIANREIEVDTLRKVQQESKTLMNIVKKCKKDASNVASRVDSLSKERGVLKSQAEQLHARTQELELKTTLLRSQLDAAHVKLGSLERMRSLGQANIMLTGEG